MAPNCPFPPETSLRLAETGSLVSQRVLRGHYYSQQGYPQPPSAVGKAICGLPPAVGRAICGSLLCGRQGYLRRFFLAADKHPLPSNGKRAGSGKGSGPLGLRGMGGA